jgi:hypothetical protein
MNRFHIIFLCSFFPILLSAQQKLDSLLGVLDNTVDNYQLYANQKEQKLADLYKLLGQSKSEEQAYFVYGQFLEEYNSYKSDSALKYAQQKLNLAEKLNDIKKLNESRLDMALIWCLSGMYKESFDILQNIDKDAVPSLKVRYFDTYRTVMGYMADFAVDQEKKKYGKQMDAFRDSLVLLSDPKSSGYFIDNTYVLINQHKEELALKRLLAHFQTIHKVRDKAYVAYTISVLYKNKGDKQQEKYWLAMSAINDLQSNNKEYLSLRSLAYMLYEEGDIDRSYKFIRRSLDDALFCNSRNCTIGISRMLPFIDKAYQAQAKARQRQLVLLLICISLLSLFLVVAAFALYRQMRKLTIARKEVSEVNDELRIMNQSLQESNTIKEEYIGRYVDQCSIYIEKLDDYRRMLNKAATAGKMGDLLRTIKSNRFIDEELKVFYNNFDSTFVQLFPTFVADFTALLDDNDYIQLKPGQLLNTELRVYALMRLGISDVAKISGFLRRSDSTIYTYRHKIKDKSRFSREEFEEKVMRIGTLN